MNNLTNSSPIEEENLSPEEKKDLLLLNEDSILAALIGAANAKEDPENFQKIKIVRKGKELFAFRIRPLSEEDLQDCRKRNITKKKQRYGVTNEELNVGRYRSDVIYTATVEEDRKKVWNNAKALAALNVIRGVDLIDVVLFAGEKDQIYDKIEEISGYDSSVDETIKN